MSVYLLPFEKMHGLGNDFIFLERRHMPNGCDDVKLAKLLCNRHTGIGADGLIVVDFPSTTDADFKWDYYNNDGSIAEMCGNGMRCFAKYVYERGLTDQADFKVLTKAGIIKPSIQSDGSITVNMGSPKLPSSNYQDISANGKNFTFTYVETGNPHCVIFNHNEISDVEFAEYGPLIERHKFFPHGVNVEFANVLNRNEINLRVWERGCGPTLACGTGACATLVAAALNNLTEDEATLKLPGGNLKIKWDKINNLVYKNGPATFVYAGQFNLNPGDVCR